MDIDIDRSLRAIDLQEAYGVFVLHYCILISFIYCSSHSLAVDQSVIYIYALKSAVASGKARLARVSLYPVSVDASGNFEHGVCRLLAVYGIDGIEHRT